MTSRFLPYNAKVAKSAQIILVIHVADPGEIQGSKGTPLCQNVRTDFQSCSPL